MIDLSERIIQPAPPSLRAPNGSVKWHPWRRVIQVLCGVLLVALPLTNGLRLDVRRDEFYFAWHRMAAHDLFLLFWVSMLGVWSLATVSLLYGRLWCGWVCPQTLASDFADSLRQRLDKSFRRLLSPNLGGQKAVFVARTVWTLTLLAVSLGTGYVLACYWLAPATVARAMVHPLADWSAALTAYGLAAVLAADMLWLRRRFCAHACPYGPLLGVLSDRNTLSVRYLDERDDDCIRCGKCVTDCPMGIDIKKGVAQFACIGCGECVDSCNDVLGKRGKPGLIEFRYGLAPERETKSLTVAQRWGLWDRTRIGVVLTLLACLGAVVWCLYGRLPLAASVVANGAITRDANWVRNTYALTLTNGTPDNQTYALSVAGLPQGQVETNAPVRVEARDLRTVPVTVAAPVGALRAYGRTPITLHIRAGRDQATVKTLFFTPAP